MCAVPLLFLRRVVVLSAALSIAGVSTGAGQSAGGLDELATQAAAAQKGGDYSRARDLYTELASRRPDVPEIRANIGFMDHLLGDYSGAVANLQAAISQKPSLTNAAVVLGTDLVKLRRPKEAIPYLDPLCRAGRVTVQACLVMGEAQVMMGNYLEGAECYKRVLAAQPADSEAAYDLGIVYLGMFRYAAERIAQVHGSTYLQQLKGGGPSAAATGDLSVLWKSARASPAPETWYRAALAARRSAADSLTNAYRLDPDSPKARILLAQAEGSESHWDAAEREYRAALNKNPNDASANLGLAGLYLQLFRLDDCSRLADRVLAARALDPQANYLKAQVLVLQGHYDEALPRLRNALQADPATKPHVYGLLAKVYTSQGRWSEAIDALKHAKTSDDNGSIEYQLYRLYQKTGNQEAAAAALAASRKSLAREREHEQSAFQKSVERALHDTVER